MEKIARPLVNFNVLGKTAVYTAIASAVFLATHANAQLLHNVTLGNPKALAMGNAVTADPPGIDSIHFNPAGLSKISGRQRQVKLLVADMTLETQFGEPTRPTQDEKDAFLGVSGPACDGQTADECWGVDRDVARNASVSSADPVLMLPFAGLVEVPVLAFPIGGVAFEDSTNGWSFGTAVYSPEGVGFSRDKDSAGAFQGYEVGVTRLTYFSPTVAIDVTDQLSVGAGINFSYHGLGINTLFRAPMITSRFLSDLTNEDINEALGLYVIHPYDTVGDLSLELEDYLSVGFNFGMLWEPYDWLAFGFTYKSESTAHMSGDFKMVNSPEFQNTTNAIKGNTGTAGLPLDLILTALTGDRPFNNVPVEEGGVELDYIVPQSLAFGTSVRVLPDFKVNVDMKWIEYSVWDQLDFKFDRPVDFLTLASVVNFFALSDLDNADSNEMRIRRAYDDVWSWAIGGEWQYTDNLVLRAGYEPRGAAVPDGSADLLFPIGDANLYSFGFGYQLDNTSRVEGAFGMLISETTVAACESLNANSCEDGDVVYNPYFSTPFENKTTAYLFALSYDQKF